MVESTEAPARFYGKYRGLVVDNVDPLKLVRLKVLVPAVTQASEIWAMPCIPYAGNAVGMHVVPPVDAHLWVEFEAGDPSYPIWTGCYWEDSEFTDPGDTEADEPPLVKVLKTTNSVFMIDDNEGAGFVKLEIAGAAVDKPVTLLFDNDGATFTCGKCSIKMNPNDGITLQVTDTTITMTDDSIKLKSGSIANQADNDIGLNAGTALDFESGTTAKLAAGTSLEISAGSSGSLETSAGLDISAGSSGSVKSGGSLDIQSGGEMSLQGPVININ